MTLVMNEEDSQVRLSDLIMVVSFEITITPKKFLK